MKKKEKKKVTWKMYIMSVQVWHFFSKTNIIKYFKNYGKL